jgi:hypothetical protein
MTLKQIRHFVTKVADKMLICQSKIEIEKTKIENLVESIPMIPNCVQFVTNTQYIDIDKIDAKKAVVFCENFIADACANVTIIAKNVETLYEVVKAAYIGSSDFENFYQLVFVRQTKYQ